MTLEFFGEVDKNSKGEIASSMPAWYHEVKIEDLKERVAKKERQIENGQILSESVPLVKQEIRESKEKIEQIEASKPILRGGQKDMIAKVYHDLQNQIATSIPSIRDEREGYANPRDELKRMKDKHLTVSPEMAEAYGVKHVKGKISGDDGNRMYKMIGKLLGENQNIEKIRREGRSEAQKQMDELTKLALGNLNGREGIKA